jgi:hypothetical protein
VILSDSIDFIRETQISKTKCIEICKSINLAESGGYNTPSLVACAKATATAQDDI